MRWLLNRQPFVVTLPVVGVMVSDLFVAVSISGPPVRITGVYRTRLCGVTAADRGLEVDAAAAEARSILRTPVGTPAVLTLEPAQPTVDLPLADGWGRRPLPVIPDCDATSALERAGFGVDRFDALPAALARFASCSTQHRGQLRACGWEVSVSAEALVAQADTERLAHRGMANQDPASFERSTVPDLHGVRLPDAVRRHLKTDFDAGAIGAALRGFWFHPDLLVDMQSTPVITSMTPLPRRSGV